MNIIATLGTVKKDGTAPVYLIVYINGKRVRFHTKVFCNPNHFNEEKGWIRGSTKDVKDKNLMITSSRKLLKEIFIRYRLQEKQLTPELLKNEYKNPSLRVDFHQFLEEAIKERKGESSEGTIKRDRVFQNKLKEFRPDIAFSEIDAEFVEQFRKWLRKKHHNGINSQQIKLKVFKLYLNIAKRKGIIEKSPFDDIRIKKEKTERVFLEEHELRQLWKSYLAGKYSSEPGVHRILRHFLFMCFTGLDYMGLKESAHFDNRFGDKLVFIREKTASRKKNQTKMPLTTKALQLITDEGHESGNFFSVFTEQTMNRALKNIATDHKIHKRITTHVGRHTFATLFIQKTADVATLQKLLGHSSITTTMVYVHITDQQIDKQMKQFDELISF